MAEYQVKLIKRTGSIQLKKVQKNIVLQQVGRRGVQGEPGVVQSIIAGTNISVDSTDPANPIVSSIGVNAVESVNGQIGVVVLDTDDINDTATNRYTNDTDVARLANTSGTNTGDQDLSGYASERIVATVTTPTTGGSAINTDYVYLLSSGSYTQPSAVSNNNRYTLKNISGANYSIASTLGQTFDGGTLVIGVDESVDLIKDNTNNWRIV